jgi:aryl-alcohol dehydrogenase-like predicted oxidoreductase
MESRILGNSEMHISRIGLGAWAIGGDGYEWGWGPQDDEDSIRTIHAALDQGINWIDTAPAYGLGRSERVVGQAIKGMSQKPWVFTKCGYVWGEDRIMRSTLKADSVRQEVEDSLRRLQVETIDLLQIHWPNPEREIEEGWHTLAELQKAGKIRYIGVSNFNVAQMERCAAIAPITSLQPPYSIVVPDVETEILPYCARKNIGTIIYSPLQSGLLTGKMTRERIQNLPDSDFRKTDEHFVEPLLSRNLRVVEVLRQIAERHQVTIAEIAIAWTLRNPDVTAAIVGARRPDQIGGVIGAVNIELGDDDLEAIRAVMR